ncbi:hypothetical protein EMCRGX_G023422 [Ephydatia muelleri]
MQAVGPALLQAVAALLLAVAEGPALLQAVAGLLLAVAVGPALLQAVAALLLAVAVGPALLQAAAALKLSILLYLEHIKNGCPFQKKPKEATLHMEAKHLLETERVDKHSNPDIVGDERTLEKFLTQMASIRSQQTAEKTYEMQTLYGLKAVDNPMLSIGFNPFIALQHVVLNTIGLSCATIEDLHRHDSSTTIERFHCMEDSLVAVFKGIIAAEGRLVHAGDFVELLCSETKYALFLTSCQLETGESFCVLQGYDEFVVNSEPVLNEYECPLLAITKRIFSADCSQIKQAVSIVHECSDSCTFDWGSREDQERRLW